MYVGKTIVFGAGGDGNGEFLIWGKREDYSITFGKILQESYYANKWGAYAEYEGTLNEMGTEISGNWQNTLDGANREFTWEGESYNGRDFTPNPNYGPFEFHRVSAE